MIIYHKTLWHTLLKKIFLLNLIFAKMSFIFCGDMRMEVYILIKYIPN